MLRCIGLGVAGTIFARLLLSVNINIFVLFLFSDIESVLLCCAVGLPACGVGFDITVGFEVFGFNVEMFLYLLYTIMIIIKFKYNISTCSC